MAVSCQGGEILQLNERQVKSGKHVESLYRGSKEIKVTSSNYTERLGVRRCKENETVTDQKNLKNTDHDSGCSFKRNGNFKCPKFQKDKFFRSSRRGISSIKVLIADKDSSETLENGTRPRTQTNPREAWSSRRSEFLWNKDLKDKAKSKVSKTTKKENPCRYFRSIFCPLSDRRSRYQGLGYFWAGMLWAVMFSEFCVSSRTVRTKYGDVSGVIVTPDNRYLDAVEVFKGVPYASPPVGSLRFMPPVTGAMWTGVRMANRFSAVCPQNLPDLRNETDALHRMPRGRLEYLKRVLPYLSNQSEDCLYLNIYVPAHADLLDNPTMFPVLVYIHGESYKWGAGSLYDGSVLASYGGLVVVTVNYRLGVLGFLNANSDPQQRSPSNYGLMDQIAALHWIRENIAHFGGDPRNVTLMGHGTGAACVHFLMISTAVPEGQLFQRAILMSGSALCPWALVKEPGRYSRQVARHVGCPQDLQLLACLRDRPLESLLSAPVESPDFLTAFGPSVDGVVIGGRSLGDENDGYGPVHFHNFLSLNNLAFRKSMVAKMSRYDLLLGMVKLESYFSFTAEDVQYGIESDRKARIMRTYVRNTYRYHQSEILATVLNEYTDWERPVQHPINIRDETMDALSDALVVAPLVRMADLHTPTHSAGSYMYVFDYQTRLGDYPQKQGCVHGEELPYVFGAPLVSSMSHFSRNFTKTEVQLSEVTLDYWTNFIKTGNPNQGRGMNLHLGIRLERQKTKNMDWLAYDRIHKRYIQLDMKPKIKSHYRAHRLSFWLHLVPDLNRPGGEDVPRSHHQLDHSDATDQLHLVTDLPHSAREEDVKDLHHQVEKVNSPQQDLDVTSHKTVHSLPPTKDQQEIVSPMNETLPVVMVASSKGSPRRAREDWLAAHSSTLVITTFAVGGCLVFLNIVAFLLVFCRKRCSTQPARKTSDSLQKRVENGGPMATICVTSGATELSTVETILTATPTPILRRDLRLLVLQTPPDASPPCELREFPDGRPPLPPKTSRLTSQVVTEAQPLLSPHTHLKGVQEDVLRV